MGANVTFTFIHSADRSSSDEHAQPGVFAGYDQHRQAYQVIFDGAYKHVVAQSVAFKEREIVEQTRVFFDRVQQSGKHIEDFKDDSSGEESDSYDRPTPA